jgi:2-methylcitrate dehydratase PrpD
MTFDDIAAFASVPLDIPDAALDAAATLLIDTLGVAAGAAPMEAAASCATTPRASSPRRTRADAAPLLFDGRIRVADRCGVSRWPPRSTTSTPMTG